VLEAAQVAPAAPVLAWLGTPPHTPAWGAFVRTLAGAGAAEAVREYQRRRQAHPGEPQIPEAAMNQAGYALLRGGKVKDAIALFRQNVEDHPESWNVHDSLAEALAADGDKEGAIRSYERSLELNAANAAAREAIKKLRSQRP